MIEVRGSNLKEEGKSKRGLGTEPRGFRIKTHQLFRGRRRTHTDS